jgi:hypothetical protein
MNFKQITKFEKCGILIHKNNVETNGFDKNTSFEEIINIAKNGLCGKWYLKGQNMDVSFLKTKITESIGSSRSGVCCYLIEC